MHTSTCVDAPCNGRINQRRPTKLLTAPGIIDVYPDIPYMCQLLCLLSCQVFTPPLSEKPRALSDTLTQLTNTLAQFTMGSLATP